jgi:Fe-S-cluster-containing dehydrogenase component
MTDTSHKRLIIDLHKCDQCESCNVICGYYNRPQAEEHGIPGLRERAAFALVCRRCSHASCIEACVFDALERGEGGILERHNMRCVSCKMCAHACPFGTIYPELLSFYVVNCDACLGFMDSEPPCVASCSRGALEFRQLDSSEPDVHVIDLHLAARTKRWIRREATA